MVNTVKEMETQPCQQRERSGLGNPKADKIVLRGEGPGGGGSLTPSRRLGGQHLDRALGLHLRLLCSRKSTAWEGRQGVCLYSCDDSFSWRIVGLKCCINFCCEHSDLIIYICLYTYIYTYMYILKIIFLFITVYPRILNTIPCSVKQDLVLNLLYAEEFVFASPELPVLPPHRPAPLENTRSVSVSASLFLFCGTFLCITFQIPRVNDIIRCLSFSYLFHSAWWCLGPSVLVQMALVCSLLCLSNSPLYICTPSFLSIHLSMDVVVASVS